MIIFQFFLFAFILFVKTILLGKKNIYFFEVQIQSGHIHKKLHLQQKFDTFLRKKSFLIKIIVPIYVF